MSIHEMFEEQDERVLELVPNYEISLIAPASIKDDDFGKFRTSLREVLAFIKYSQDAGRLGEVLEADEGFRRLGRAEVDVLNACVGAKLTMEKREEAIDVCLAIQQMEQNAAERERISTLLKSIKNLMEKLGWTADHAMDILEVSESDRKEISQRI